MKSNRPIIVPLGAVIGRLLFGMSFALAASSCNGSTSSKPMPDFKQNPNPEQAYQVTLTIANAPGPFTLVKGVMQFDVVTPECLPPPDENGGDPWPTPTHDISIEWVKVSDTEYTGTVYLDGMVDEDYYGRGVCRWELIQARADLWARSKTDTRFMPNIHPDKLQADQAETTYFVKSNYPRHPESTLEDPLSFGQTDRSKMSNLKDDDLFTITFAPRRVSP